MWDQRTILTGLTMYFFFFFVHGLIECKVGLLYLIETQLTKDRYAH